jgi:hypothetical protein
MGSNERRYRDHAEEARLLAEQMGDPELQKQMITIAEDFDRYAASTEEMERLMKVEKGRYLSSDYWRDRAEEARTKAEAMRDPDAKAALLLAAENYEKLADRTQELERLPRGGGGQHQVGHDGDLKASGHSFAL